MIVDVFRPFFAGYVILLELFTNFLVKLIARSFTKFAEIFEIERSNFT